MSGVLYLVTCSKEHYTVCISYRPDFNHIHITPETKKAEQCCIQLHAQAPGPYYYDDSNHVMSSSGFMCPWRLCDID